MLNLYAVKIWHSSGPRHFETIEVRTEDEIAAERAAAKETNGRRLHAQAPCPTAVPAHLPRERIVVPAPTACACCGGTRLRKLGETVTETLEVIPRQWKVIQHVREKMTCRDCEKISEPPAPFHVTPRGWAGPHLLAMLTFSGWCCPNFSNSSMARRCGLGPSARRDVERRRRLADLLAIPATSSSRVHAGSPSTGAGLPPAVSVTVSPSFLSRVPPQQAHARRCGHDDCALAGGVRGTAVGQALAREGGDRCLFRCGPLCGDLVLGAHLNGFENGAARSSAKS